MPIFSRVWIKSSLAETGKQPGKQLRLIAYVAFRGNFLVGQVAAPAARNQQLAPKTRIGIKQGHRDAPPGSLEGCHHACRSGADDSDPYWF